MDVDKLVKDAITAQSELSAKFQRAKDELADLKVILKATTGERDRLVGEVTLVKKERDEAKVTVLEYETDYECKDDYI